MTWRFAKQIVNTSQRCCLAKASSKRLVPRTSLTTASNVLTCGPELESLYSLLSFRKPSPFVFAKLNGQIREFHLTKGRKSAARKAKEFDVYNAGTWFYERFHTWSGGAVCVHMLRKNVLQDARVSEGVMMTQYVNEEDLQYQSASNAMFQQFCLSMTPEVARAFGHEHP